MILDALFSQVLEEAEYASERYGDFASTHEGFGVLSEECAELLEAIRSNDLKCIRKEALQISAVALRIAHACDHSAFRARSVK